MLRGSVNALIFLKDNDIFHGDLNPETIYLDLENHPMLMDNSFLTAGQYQLNGYSRYFFKQT